MQNNHVCIILEEANCLATQQVTWDLTELFLSITDPKINQAIIEATVLADAFEKTYRDKIIELAPDGLLRCLHDVEMFEAKFSDLALFSSLSFGADMTQPQAQSLNDRVDKLESNIAKQLAFYSLELCELLKSKPQIIQEPVLANYRYALERLYRRVEHQLSEVEEQLIIEKDQFGVNAWAELQSKWLNTRLFEVMVRGEKKH
jgi:oligoendopeptidase F